MSIVKSQILSQLADSYPNFSRKILEKSLNLVFDEIIVTLIRDQRVEIRSFGSFRTRQLKARIGRNPRDHTTIEIPEKKNIHWKMSKELLRKLNQDTKHNE